MAKDDARKELGGQATDPVRRDLNSGLRFLHAMGMQTKGELFEAAAGLKALIELLVSRGIIDLRAFETKRARYQNEDAERYMEQAHVSVSDEPDKYHLKDLPQIDCEARIPLCKGRCCKLNFSLSFQDLTENVVKWDYSRPYRILQRVTDGYCVHNDPDTKGCGVYDNRPAICRTYDCREDSRIWLDFEKRIPAPE
jgi:Fe-S-cluster containining protein